MELTAEQIRASAENLKQARKDGWELSPIRQWGPKEYVVIDGIVLKEGLQRLAVIDITDMNDVARISGWYPEQGWNEESNRARRKLALVHYTDAGFTHVMLEGECLTGYHAREVWRGDLAIRIMPGNAKDRRVVRDEMDDELQEHVDAGGALRRM